jgi:hypothetical protein
MLVNMLNNSRIKEGEELRAPRYASAAATRNDRLPYSRYYPLGKVLLKKLYL